MKRSEDRILTTHVGNIVRPKELLALGAAAKSDVAKKQAYETCLKDAVAAVVTKQADVGLDIVNDGELENPAGPIISWPGSRASRFANSRSFRSTGSAAKRSVSPNS
jgi:hypothetical protein